MSWRIARDCVCALARLDASPVEQTQPSFRSPRQPSVHAEVLDEKPNIRHTPFIMSLEATVSSPPMKEDLFVRVHIICSVRVLLCNYAVLATIAALHAVDKVQKMWPLGLTAQGLHN